MLEHGEQPSEPKMSLEEAEAYHDRVLEEYDEDASTQFNTTDLDLPAKFSMAEIETETSLSGPFQAVGSAISTGRFSMLTLERSLSKTESLISSQRLDFDLDANNLSLIVEVHNDSILDVYTS